MSGSCTTELRCCGSEGAWGSGEGVGKGLLITNVLGSQSNGTYDEGSCKVGRRGTMEPLARTKSVLPVVLS